MTFIITFIALLIERFFDWSHLRNWNWYAAYQQKIAKRCSGISPYFVLAIIILPLLIAVFFIQWALQDVLFGFGEILFQLFIFLYCLGPQNFWADTFACVNALVQGDSQAAAEKLKTSFGDVKENVNASLHQQLLQQIFIAANRRVFAVIFWFIILGPIGVVLYRTVTLSASDNAKQDSELAKDACSIESALDWIPIRIFTCLFALSGHFVQVFSCWRKKVMRGLDINSQLLLECGAAALGKEDIETLAQDGSAEKHVISLLDRTLVITFIVFAILAMI
jgi:AmpE protein